MDTALSKARVYHYRSLLDFLIRRLPGFGSFVFTLLVSRQLTGFAFYAGIWFMTGQVCLMCAEAFYSGDKRLFTKKRKTVYLLTTATAVAVCAAATAVFLGSIKPGAALALFVFVINQLAGVALLEGSMLFPVTERQRLAVNLAGFSVVSAAALLVCRFVALQAIPWQMIAYDGTFLLFLCLKAVLTPHHGGPRSEADIAGLDQMESIYAYRQYRGMAANVLAGIETTILLLTCYALSVSLDSGANVLLDSARMLAVFGVGMWACRALMHGDRIKSMGTNIAFILFSLLWITLNIYTYRHPNVLQGNNLLLPLALVSLCMAALSTVLLNMDRYMAAIGELGHLGLTPDRYAVFKNTVFHSGAILSRGVLVLVMAAATLYFGLFSTSDYIAAAMLVRHKLVIIPLAFLLPAALSALRQPLTRYYEEKLGRFASQKVGGAVSKALEQRLLLSLVRKGGKRIGIVLLKAVVKPFVTLKRINASFVDPKRFPCVFVCNHAEVFGPIAATVNIPYFNRPWIIQEMVDADKIAAHMQTGFDHALWIPAPVRSRLGRLFGPFILWVMRSMDPIPVYRNNIKDIMKTISLSVEALEAEDNILIFPENPFATGNRYVVDGVGEFFEGFVHIAKTYYRDTGKPLVFYSVYVSQKARTICFSEGIEFNPDAPFGEERDRVCGHLHQEMVRMHREQG